MLILACARALVDGLVLLSESPHLASTLILTKCVEKKDKSINKLLQ